MNKMNDTAHCGPCTSLRRLCVFLSRYGAALIGAGATCIRVEKNVQRIAAAFGVNVDMTIMPRHVHISIIGNDTTELLTAIASVPASGVSFNINTGLSKLSWNIVDQKMSLDEAQESFDHIINSDYQNKWFVLGVVSLANAAFCRLFGGDLYAMAIVGIATLAGYYMKQLCLSYKINLRLVFIICSFISSVLGATGLLFNIGSTPGIALATSVLYLVPGIPYLNSFSDMLASHYLNALSRFTDALILTCCMSAGLCAGMLLMHANMF
ncbi:MAG: threonine/serine exporter family protein [Odoribacter sp.]|nr:threonine/serine exporter family protein [Odoribacter sp.]